MMNLEHPVLGFECPVTQETITLGFGYMNGVPMIPIFKGEVGATGGSDLIAMLPREVLIAALQEGWGGEQSGWWVDPSNN